MNPITTVSQFPRRSPRLSYSSYTSRLMITASASVAASSSRATQHRRITQSPTASISAEIVMTTDDLLHEILSRLTAKELFSLTLVSRCWNNVITNPTLISHWKGRPTYPVSIYIRRNSHGTRVQLIHIPLIRPAGRTRGGALKRTICSLDFVPDPRGLKINQSCNGLFICSSSRSCVDNYLQYFYVYNPTTKYFINIPRPILDQKYVVSMNLAFESPCEYKIVAVISSIPIREYHIEVYEPRTSRYWRDRELNFPIYGPNAVVFDYGVYMNGAVYWPSYKPGGLMYFKIKEEEIVWLTEVPQPSRSDGDIVYFGECGGRLRMVRSGSVRGGRFDLLELETDHSMWYIKYRIDLRPQCSNHVTFFILALVTGEKGRGGEERDDDSSIILYVPGQVVSYNFKDQRVKKICDLRLRQCDMNALSMQRWYYVHPCLETFLRP